MPPHFCAAYCLIVGLLFALFDCWHMGFIAHIQAIGGGFMRYFLPIVGGYSHAHIKGAALWHCITYCFLRLRITAAMIHNRRIKTACRPRNPILYR
jgi:hypothetical protein